MQRPLVFCLTPVKNEAWILERFLKCASLWADQIIIADQGSTDGSKEIAARFPKVTIIDNSLQEYNEPERQKLLIAEARRTPGHKVLLALDADEFLTANFLTSPEWESILTSPPGTVISFQWPIIQANMSDLSFFYFRSEIPVGFIDDGTEHDGKLIHSCRVPNPPGAPSLLPTQIKLMHYCLLDRDRFRSRMRWYQCFEYLTLKRRPIELYRFYNLVVYVSSEAIKPVPPEWIRGYEEQGIEMSIINRPGGYRWDKEVLEYFEEHGVEKFRRLGVWDVDWSVIYHDICPGEPQKPIRDPRSGFERLVHRWLEWTQPNFCLYAKPGLAARVAQKLVRKALWVLGW